MTEREQGTEHPIPRGPGRHDGPAVITDARLSTSAEMSQRIRRYTITMAFRTACFISMLFVHGAFRWVLFACAVLLPYVAVVLANQANQRQTRKRPADVMPTDHLQLTTGSEDVISGRLVEGDEDGAGHERAGKRVA